MATGGRDGGRGAEPVATPIPGTTASADDADVTRHATARRVWAIVALPLISIVLSVVVGSLVIIFSEWLVAGHSSTRACRSTPTAR